MIRAAASWVFCPWLVPVRVVFWTLLLRVTV